MGFQNALLFGKSNNLPINQLPVLENKRAIETTNNLKASKCT